MSECLCCHKESESLLCDDCDKMIRKHVPDIDELYKEYMKSFEELCIKLEDGRLTLCQKDDKEDAE